jgi:hypothetical protein
MGKELSICKNFSLLPINIMKLYPSLRAHKRQQNLRHILFSFRHFQAAAFKIRLHPPVDFVARFLRLSRISMQFRARMIHNVILSRRYTLPRKGARCGLQEYGRYGGHKLSVLFVCNVYFKRMLTAEERVSSKTIAQSLLTPANKGADF